MQNAYAINNMRNTTLFVFGYGMSVAAVKVYIHSRISSILRAIAGSVEFT